MDGGTGQPEHRSEIREGGVTTAQAHTAPHHDVDRAAVERASTGDSEAFEALVRKYQNWVFTLAYRMMGDRAEAEDMAQEIFLKVYRALPRFEAKSRFSTWLYTIATNHCLNHLESRRRRPRLQEAIRSARPEGHADPVETRIADPAPGADQVLERADLRRLVREHLLRLTPEHRAILVLRDIQGLAYEEIGALLGLESGTVRSRLHRARMELKERLKAYS